MYQGQNSRFLADDDFVTYVETEEEKQKPRYVLTHDAKVALTDYYDTVHILCKAQQNFTKSTQVLEKKIADKSVFLDIIKQVLLPSVKVEIRTVEEMERMEGKTYRELTLMCHLPNFKRINPNTNEQTRMMAAYMYCVLHEQITGIRASQTGCTTDFKCQMTPFKRLITGRDSPADQAGRAQQEEGPAEAWKMSPRWKVLHQPREQGRQPNQQQQGRGNERQIVRRSSKPSEQIVRTGRVDKI